MRRGASALELASDMLLAKFSKCALIAAILVPFQLASPCADCSPASGDQNRWSASHYPQIVGTALAQPAPPAAAQERLDHADDLAATARGAGARRVPVMIVFTEASCPYCARAKRDYLVPLQSRGPFAEKVVVREVDVASDRRLRDFDGRTTTHRDYARRHQVRKVPTVMVMNPRGEPLAAPIVGLLAPDFYPLTLEHAIEEGLFKLRAGGPRERDSRVVGGSSTRLP